MAQPPSYVRLALLDWEGKEAWVPRAILTGAQNTGKTTALARLYRMVLTIPRHDPAQDTAAMSIFPVTLIAHRGAQPQLELNGEGGEVRPLAAGTVQGACDIVQGAIEERRAQGVAGNAGRNLTVRMPAEADLMVTDMPGFLTTSREEEEAVRKMYREQLEGHGGPVIHFVHGDPYTDPAWPLVRDIPPARLLVCYTHCDNAALCHKYLAHAADLGGRGFRTIFLANPDFKGAFPRGADGSPDFDAIDATEAAVLAAIPTGPYSGKGGGALRDHITAKGHEMARAFVSGGAVLLKREVAQARRKLADLEPSRDLFAAAILDPRVTHLEKWGRVALGGEEEVAASPLPEFRLGVVTPPAFAAIWGKDAARVFGEALDGQEAQGTAAVLMKIVRGTRPHGGLGTQCAAWPALKVALREALAAAPFGLPPPGPAAAEKIAALRATVANAEEILALCGK
jgi:hypothetical protein